MKILEAMRLLVSLCDMLLLVVLLLSLRNSKDKDEAKGYIALLWVFMINILYLWI